MKWFAAAVLAAIALTAADGGGSPRPAAAAPPPRKPALVGENLARGKPYTLDPRPNYAYCTDPDDVRQLTDGEHTAGHFWTQKSTVGWVNSQPAIITVDLGSVQPIRGASYRTAAGVAGVEWPLAVYVLVSDDGRRFYEAGELVTLSAKHGLPPREGYATHRFRTEELRAHGRYVSFVVSGAPYIFVDEVEVLRGEPAWVNLPFAGEPVPDAKSFFQRQAIRQAIARRLRQDAQAVRELLEKSAAPAGARREIAAELATVERELPNLPREYGRDFRAVLPLNAPHRRVFHAQARLWRAMGLAPLTVWRSGLWDPLSPTQLPPRETGAAVDVAMMGGEYRAGAFNISNAGDADVTLRLRIAGLPGGANPAYVAVREVAWTDTHGGRPVAAALPEARRDGDAYRIDVPSGLTRQVWLTFHPTNVPAGVHHGEIVLAGAGVERRVPLTLRVSSLRFPERPTLHLGGWDYTDADGQYEITPANRERVIAFLRAYFVDSPWASASALPAGEYDAGGALVSEPDTGRFDQWLRRWPGVRQYCVFASVGDHFAGSPKGTPEFDRKVKAWVTFWAGHARSRGLKPEQLAILLVDEPNRPEQDATILAWARAVRVANTGIKVWEDPTHDRPAEANQAMMAACSVLCPNRTHLLTSRPEDQQYFIERRRQGTELAFYSCSGPVRQLDPYAYHRLQEWSCWQFGAESSFFWAFGDSGGASSWNEYVAKHAAFVPFFLDATSVTPGKHMEAIREGVEDYEYLRMLRDGVAAAEQRGLRSETLDRARKLLSDAADRVCGAAGTTAFTWAEEKDRTVADGVRVEIMEALEALQKAR